MHREVTGEIGCKRRLSATAFGIQDDNLMRTVSLRGDVHRTGRVPPVQCQASDATAHYCVIRIPSTPKRSNANAEHSTEMWYCCRARKSDCSYFITVDGNTTRICAEQFACRLRSNRLSRYCDSVRKYTGRAPIEEQSNPADRCTEVLLQKLATHAARVLVPTLVPKNMSWCRSTPPSPLSGALKLALESSCRLLR